MQEPAMSAPQPGVTGRAAELRLAFDRAYAAPARPDKALTEDLLAVRVGTQAFAIRLSEISGLFADKTTTPVPGGHAALRGIAGFRGVIVPVYDLQSLLGSSCSPTARWLVIAVAAPVALAFETLERQLRVSRDAILPQPASAQAHSHAREFVRTADFVGPIMHLPSLLDAIKAWRFEGAPREKQ
jgi:chemotaxis signal transduction protein